MDIFDPTQWHDFFLMIGGGSASLTGLVFVAMSINLSVVAQDPTHKNRAIGTLTGFTAVFLICALGLTGNQNHIALGLEWLVVSIPATVIYIKGYIQAVTKGGSEKGLSLPRTIAGLSCYIAQILGSLILLSGNIYGLYLAAFGMVASFISLISGAWLLIMGIHESQEK